MSTKLLEKYLKLTGRKVAEARRRQEMTQQECAGEARISPRYLQSIEAGQVNMTLSTLLRISRPLGVNPHSLLPESGFSKKKPLGKK